jgi:hypothetical protein
MTWIRDGGFVTGIRDGGFVTDRAKGTDAYIDRTGECG